MAVPDGLVRVAEVGERGVRWRLALSIPLSCLLPQQERLRPLTQTPFRFPDGMDYFSTISNSSMGQALAQMPQAMHLVAVSPSVITCMGQTLTHSPQAVQSFLLIM